MCPGFKDYFIKHDYFVYVTEGDQRIDIDEETLSMRVSGVINIVPATTGGKKKGAGKLLAGIALIGISFIPGLNAAVFGALGGVAGTSAGVSSGLASAFSAVTTAKQLSLMVGLSLAVGGATQLTAPKIGKETKSNLFGGVPESVSEGPPVPLVYGKYLAVCYPASFEIVNSTNRYGSLTGSIGGGGGGGLPGGWSTVRNYEV